MKSLTIRVIYFVFMAGILSGCQSHQTVLTFHSYGKDTQHVELEVNGDTLSVPYDTLRGATFHLEDMEAGYVILHKGGLRKLLYLEPGMKLTVSYGRPNLTKSRFQFDGKGAAENRFLDEHTLGRLSFPGGLSADKVTALLRDSVRALQAELRTAGLSEAFTRLESERLRYQVLSKVFRYNGFDSRLFPFLQENLQDNPALLLSEDYQTYILNTLFVLGGGNDSTKTLYECTKAQMNYLFAHNWNKQVADYVMEYILKYYMTMKGADGIAPLMDDFNHHVASPSVRQRIKNEYQLWEKVLKGKAIPEFTFEDIGGNQVSLSDFKGKYVYIDCWATWCGPCRAQIPHLKKLEHDYAGRNIEFVSISSDSNRDKWKNTVKAEKLGGIQLIDTPASSSEFFEYFVIRGIPRFIVLDTEGKVYNANAPRPSDPAIRVLFDKLLFSCK